jgi:Animal haem peroxidase
MNRHGRDEFFVAGEGVLTVDEDGNPITRQPSELEELRRFRFSRLGPRGTQLDDDTRAALAAAITVDATATQPDSSGPAIPAGFTYLGQFVDHDLTMDATKVALGDDVTVDELQQGRSPALDLDSVYGRGPRDAHDRDFYADGVRLKIGTTQGVGFPPNDPVAGKPQPGFDLPRIGTGTTNADKRTPLIPDHRNDENLVVAQTHLAFIRFHNRVVDELSMRGIPGRVLFEAARTEVVQHYQWMLRTDFLPRIVEPSIVDDVFTRGRKFFEPRPFHALPLPGNRPTMPIEFAIAAYRLGHSMIRDKYEWNRVFSATGPGRTATLLQLFTFTGTSGNFTPGSPLDSLDDVNSGAGLVLPSNWIADFRRLYEFAEANRPDLVVPPEKGNVTKRIDTLISNPLAQLPAGTFGGRLPGAPLPDTDPKRSLSFRNLTRARMVSLASGQQMAKLFHLPPLTPEQIRHGNGGASLDALPQVQQDAIVANTPLWFYILRESELNPNGSGRLSGVGGRLVAEVFHRAIEGSRVSIVRTPQWRPTFGPDRNTFRMTDLLLFAFQGKAELLNPLGD